MNWWRKYFWIILAVAIITVSLVLSFILYCLYRWKFKQGKGHVTWQAEVGWVAVNALELLWGKSSPRAVWTELWGTRHALWV